MRRNTLGNFECLIALLILIFVVNDELTALIGVPLLMEVGDERDSAKWRALMVRGHIGLIGIIMRGETVAHPIRIIIEI